MIEDVLIKLRRQCGKYELVLYLIKVNSELNIELGKLKSEVLYLVNEKITCTKKYLFLCIKK